MHEHQTPNIQITRPQHYYRTPDKILTPNKYKSPANPTLQLNSQGQNRVSPLAGSPHKTPDRISKFKPSFLNKTEQ